MGLSECFFKGPEDGTVGPSGDPNGTMRWFGPGRGRGRSAWWDGRRIEGGIVFGIVNKALGELSLMQGVRPLTRLSSAELG